jgi:thioredoxin 1
MPAHGPAEGRRDSMRQRTTGYLHGLALGVALLLAGCGGGGSPAGASNPLPPPAAGSGAAVALDASNFDSVVTGGVCLVEFFHPACSHCQNMEPIVEQLATSFDGRAVVGKVDVTASPELARTWGVRGYPTFVVVRDGRELSRSLGEQTYDQLATIVLAALGE